MSDVRIQLVSLVTAFEVLFELTAIRSKGVQLADRIEELLRPSFDKWGPTDAIPMFRNLRKFVKDMYKARSDILHEGETDNTSLLFLSRKSTDPFIGFLWKGRQLFIACVRARLGILERVELALILRDLVSNEDRLRRIVSGLASADPNLVREALHLCSDLLMYPSPESNELIIEAWGELVSYSKSLGFRPSRHIQESLKGGDPFALHRLFMAISEEKLGDASLPNADHDQRLFASWALERFVEYALYAILLPHKVSEARR